MSRRPREGGGGSGAEDGGGLRSGRWSSLELIRLRERFPTTAPERLARQLGRSVEAVIRRGLLLCAPSEPVSAPWGAYDDQLVRDALGVHDEATIAALLGRDLARLRARLDELSRAPRRGAWSRDELRFLQRAYGTRHDEAIALGLGRSVEDVRSRATELALGKDKAEPRLVVLPNSPRRMPRWTVAELAELRRRYPEEDNLTIARALGRSVQSVTSKASELGISKSAAALRRMGRQNVRARASRGTAPSHRSEP